MYTENCFEADGKKVKNLIIERIMRRTKSSGILRYKRITDSRTGDQTL